MAAGVAFMVASCCNCGKVASRKGGALTGDRWQLVQMEGRAFAAENDAYTLTFAEDKKVTGKGDCNRLTGTFENDGANGKLTFGPMAATRMMCPDQASENQFLRLLGTIDSYSIDGRIMTLFANGEQKLMFEKK